VLISLAYLAGECRSVVPNWGAAI